MKRKAFVLASLLSVFYGTSGLRADGQDALRIFHCSLLVGGQAFGDSTRQMGFDIQEGQAVNLSDNWRVSVFVTGGSFVANGTMLFASVQRTGRSRNLLTVVAEPDSLSLGGVANVWPDDLGNGLDAASIYLTCSADPARGISPDRP